MSPSHHCYMFLDRSLSFYHCQKECEELDGTLACVRDAADNLFLKGLIGTKMTFIGYTDRRSEGTWEWISKDCSSSFTGWTAGEPNDFGKGEDCASMPIWNHKQGPSWNDEICTCARGCLCEHGLVLLEEFKSQQWVGGPSCWDNGGAGEEAFPGGTIFASVLLGMIFGSVIIGIGVGCHFCQTEDKLKTIAISGGGAGIMSVGCLVIAMAVFAARPPSDEELGASDCDLNDRWWEAHATLMIIFGIFTWIPGMVGLIGAWLAIIGVQRRDHGCLLTGSICLGVCGGIACSDEETSKWVDFPQT